MDFVVGLNCPQYVNFVENFNNNNESIADAEVSACSVEDSMESECMHVDDEISESCYTLDDKIPYPENVQSTPSSSYSPDNSYQESTGDSDYQAKEFPVNHHKNLSLPEKGRKNVKTNKTETRSYLNESRKRKQQFESNEYVPLAEQVAVFQRKTPKRFHNTGPKAFQPTKHWSPQLVRAKSPNLEAVKRRRVVNVVSREEQELREAEEVKRYKFHAQPVKYDKLSHIPLPNVERKLPTKPKDFHLKTAERAVEMKAKKKKEEQRYEFRARPVPKAIISGCTGLKEKPSIPVTKPKTPNFALKSREEKWERESKLKDSAPETQFKAMPAPSASSRFVVKHEKKCTEVQPFSFEAKDKERQARKEEKIHEEIEKENKVFVFKAQPMPSPQPSALPAVPKRPLTRPEPFNLCSDNRSFKQSSLNLSDQSCSSFKARPAIVLQKPPFVPEKPLKIPLETKEIRLHTEDRAAVHQKLKEEMDIKEQEKSRILQELKQLQEEEERREIRKLRKEAVHKANPVRHYKPFEIKPTDKPVTAPITPKFHSDERLRSRLFK